jgi:hypothetical protein
VYHQLARGGFVTVLVPRGNCALDVNRPGHRSVGILPQKTPRAKDKASDADATEPLTSAPAAQIALKKRVRFVLTLSLTSAPAGGYSGKEFFAVP